MKTLTTAVAFIALVAGCVTTSQPAPQPAPKASVEHFSSEQVLIDHMAQRLEGARFSRARDYAAKHTNASDQLLKYFVSGELKPGMNEEEVLVILGKPWSRISSDGIGGRFDLWNYRTSEASWERLYFSGGLLARWQIDQ